MYTSDRSFPSRQPVSEPPPPPRPSVSRDHCTEEQLQGLRVQLQYGSDFNECCAMAGRSLQGEELEYVSHTELQVTSSPLVGQAAARGGFESLGGRYEFR